jgi:hypothetical protein
MSNENARDNLVNGNVVKTMLSLSIPAILVPYYPGYPDRTSLVNYLVAMIRTVNEYNGLYSTSDNMEGILILTDTTHHKVNSKRERLDKTLRQ